MVAAVAQQQQSDGTSGSGSGNGSGSSAIAALQWLVDQTAGLASVVKARGDRAGSVLYSAVQGLYHV